MQNPTKPRHQPRRFDLLQIGVQHLTEYIIGKISHDEMFGHLYIAIRQFAKRQMTWFRGMERRGFTINWISWDIPLEVKMEMILQKVIQGDK